MDKNTKVQNKRGIPIQTRIIFSAFLIVLQIVFLFALLYNIYDYAVIYTLQEIAGIIMVIALVNRRGYSIYNTAWIILILIFPIFGICAYMLWGGARVTPRLRRKMQECERRYKSVFSDDRADHEELQIIDNAKATQADYLTRESGYPLYKNSTVEYLSPGENFLPRFLEELELAEDYIFLEFFIVAEGLMWEKIYSVLSQKARAGLDVRIIFDDFGSIKRQRKDFIARLQLSGIKVAVFNKIGPSFTLFMNNRDHRKIAIIDGKTAVTGGINIADEYINEIKRFGYWLDCAAIIKGSAVTSFLYMFCVMWEYTTGRKSDIEALKNDCPIEYAKGYVQPYSDSPLDTKNTGKGIYMRIVSGAGRYVYICSPYLIIDDTMREVLKMAARSGVDIRIITPHIPDKWYVHPVTQYNYLELMESGVRIFEYTPGFIHSKLFVSDDCVATVGTVNMDYRSFALHFECGAWMYGTDSVRNIRDHFLEIQKQCEEITVDMWHKKPVSKRLKCWLLNILAPFM